MNDREFLQRMQSFFGNLNDKRKVIKKVPIRAEWLANFEECRHLAEEIEKMMNRAAFLKRKFWVDVESAIGYEGQDMRYNTKEKTIEVLELEVAALRREEDKDAEYDDE